MAVFSVEIPDGDVDRVIGALCANYRYSNTVINPDFDEEAEEHPETNPRTIDNPESTYQFANRMTRQYLMENTHAYEVRVAKENATNSVPAPPAIEDAGESPSSLYG